MKDDVFGGLLAADGQQNTYHRRDLFDEDSMEKTVLDLTNIMWHVQDLF